MELKDAKPQHWQFRLRLAESLRGRQSRRSSTERLLWSEAKKLAQIGSLCIWQESKRTLTTDGVDLRRQLSNFAPLASAYHVPVRRDGETISQNRISLDEGTDATRPQ